MIRQDSAQTLALQALAWLAGQDDLFMAFLAQSGTDAKEVRARAADPMLLGSVLDFILTEDQWVTGFAADCGVKPDLVVAARAALPGGDVPFWT